MGQRTNIYLKNSNIYLYAHWVDTKSLGIILKNALIRGQARWDDKPYLARIIFCEMVKDEIMETTGYGISSEISDGEVSYEVDVDNQTVNGKSFEEFIK